MRIVEDWQNALPGAHRPQRVYMSWGVVLACRECRVMYPCALSDEWPADQPGLPGEVWDD